VVLDLSVLGGIRAANFSIRRDAREAHKPKALCRRAAVVNWNALCVSGPAVFEPKPSEKNNLPSFAKALFFLLI